MESARPAGTPPRSHTEASPLNTLWIILATCSNVLGVLATLCMVVMLLAGGANAKPADITILKVLIWATLAVGLLALIASIWVTLLARPMLGTAIGAAPILYVALLVIVLFSIEF